MKFAINIASPDALVKAELIPGGERNVNGDTFLNHYSNHGIVPLRLDLTHEQFGFKNFIATHMLMVNSKRLEVASKRNILNHRNAKLVSYITDFPFVKEETLYDILIRTMLFEIYMRAEPNVAILSIKTNVGNLADGIIMTSDYAAMVKRLRLWPSLVDVDKDTVQKCFNQIKKANEQVNRSLATSIKKFNEAVDDATRMIKSAVQPRKPLEQPNETQIVAG
jgi:hypothetical protein